MLDFNFARTVRGIYVSHDLYCFLPVKSASIFSAASQDMYKPGLFFSGKIRNVTHLRIFVTHLRRFVNHPGVLRLLINSCLGRPGSFFWPYLITEISITRHVSCLFEQI